MIEVFGLCSKGGRLGFVQLENSNTISAKGKEREEREKDVHEPTPPVEYTPGGDEKTGF